uniref:Uncharacterized protein n=1 Tax=Noccaea caerulescens TaxID=107243 RepID=A0A1J3JZT9_NOCCA
MLRTANYQQGNKRTNLARRNEAIDQTNAIDKLRNLNGIRRSDERNDELFTGSIGINGTERRFINEEERRSL